MQRLSLAAVLLAVAGSVAQADTIRLDSTSFSAGSGGEFKATLVTGFAGLTGLPADLADGTLQTFCVEKNENFRPGDTYSFVINTGAVQGGLGGQTSPGFDPLDERSAYLYYNFRMGTLTGYDYSNAGRQASAAQLQNAIWFIENEGGTSNAFVALAEAAIAGGQWSGIGNVRVLNLSNAEFPNGQDQLTLIPAPGAAALLGIGGLVATRRRR
jgi:hypothetical protein